jgi:signal transduction histidine kinase/CheY-like chemotaxis protein
MFIGSSISPAVRRLVLIVMIASFAGILIAGYQIAAMQVRLANLQQAHGTAERYISSLKDVETAYRGYVIAFSEAYLVPYNDAVGEFRRNAAQLRQTFSDASLGAAPAQRLIDNGEQVLQFAEEVISARRQDLEMARALVRSGQGKAFMDQVRSGINTAQEEAAIGINRISRRLSRIYVPIAIVSLLGLLLTSALFAYIATRSRAASLRARSLLADVIERAPVGLALIDHERRISQLNAAFAKMVDEKPTAMAGSKFEAVAPDIHAHVSDRLAKAFAGRGRKPEASDDIEMIDFATAAGTKYFKADVFPVTLISEDGQDAPGAGIVLHDLTRQREWELELEEARDVAESANRAKSTFIANMSHELRTPLTAVLGYCELIEDDLRDLGQTSVLEDLNKININARHLLGLINDVLDLSKIEAQKMDVHAVEFTLSTFLSEVEAATGSLMARNNNTVSLAADDPATVLFTDDLKLKQILLNLIGNAAKFTSNGAIAVRAERADVGGVPHTRFSISDTGIGMTPEQVANLFERFSQADKTTTRKYGGTGLGLALTRALTIMLGGTVSVDSIEGKGTTFTVTVPTRYVKPSAETAAAAEQEIAAASEAKPNRDVNAPLVLVVDDEASARELLDRHLTKEGFAVAMATSGAEALEKLKTHRPIAVLLDVMLPGMDGWHVLKAIRDNPATADIPVIMQTVLDDRNFAYALGASGYLKKPIKRSQLAEALKDAASANPGHEVLIVDDDQAASERLKAMLERDGWGVTLAFNGKDALEILKNRQPNLVLVDLIMPQMDGYAFVREVRNHREWDQVPLVVMTATDIGSGKVRKLEKDTAAIVQKGSMPLADLVADLRRFAEAGGGGSGDAETTDKATVKA